jgi:uracil phosphoribosyltransferase
MVQQVQLPANVHVSKHPCLQSKLSQLRSSLTTSKDVKRLIHEISLIIGCEALAQAVVAAPGPTVRLPVSPPSHFPA